MNALAFPLDVLQAVIVLALLFVVPGVALGPLLVPGGHSPLASIARAAGVSLVTTATLCTALGAVGLLRPIIVGPLLIALTVVAAVRIIRNRVHVTRRARRYWAGAAAGLVAALALVVVPSRLEVGGDLLPFSSTVWYYANLARAVATSGGFPATLPEWGATRPFQTDYLPVTAHTATAMQLLPGDVLTQLEIYRVAILVVAIVVTAALFRRWVSSLLALVAAILAVATVRLEFKFLAYKPETFALVLAMFGLWLIDRAIVERSRRLIATAAVTSALVFLSHAEVFLVFAAAAAGIAIARAAVDRRRSRVGIRLDSRRVPRLAIAPSVVLFGAIAGIAVNAVLAGEFRIASYVARTEAPVDARAVAQPDEIPSGWTFTSDPTWDFYVAAVAPAQLGNEPPTRFTDPRLLPRAILYVWPGLDARMRSLLLVLVALLLFPVIAWPFIDARRRRMLLTWWVFGVLLFAGSYLLFTLSQTYVPRRVGPRRLMPYELFLPVVAATFALWWLDRQLRPFWHALLPRRAAMAAAGVAIVVLAGAAISPGPSGADVDDQDPGLTRVGYEAYTWIAQNTPTDARILANAYTDGSVAGLGQRVGMVDGRAVYLENRRFLAESTALVLAARVVFGAPASAPASSFLARERVDYLLVAGPTASGSDLGGYRPFDTDYPALDSSGRYTLVRAFGGGRLLLYRVGAPG